MIWSKSQKRVFVLSKVFGIKEGTRLKCDDFQQNYQLNIIIIEEDMSRDRGDELFEIIGDIAKLKPKEESTSTNGSGTQPGPSKLIKGGLLRLFSFSGRHEKLFIILNFTNSLRRLNCWRIC